MKDSREEAPRARGSSNSISPSLDATGFFPARSTGEKVEMVNRVWGIWSRSDCPRQGSIYKSPGLSLEESARQRRNPSSRRCCQDSDTYVHTQILPRPLATCRCDAGERPYIAAQSNGHRLLGKKHSSTTCRGGARLAHTVTQSN